MLVSQVTPGANRKKDNMRVLKFISTAGHGYLAVRGDKVNALACATGYDYVSRNADLVMLEEDISAGLYLANFVTDQERAAMVIEYREELPNGLTRITEAGAIGAKYLKGKGW